MPLPVSSRPKQALGLCRRARLLVILAFTEFAHQMQMQQQQRAAGADQSQGSGVQVSHQVSHQVQASLGNKGAGEFTGERGVAGGDRVAMTVQRVVAVEGGEHACRGLHALLAGMQPTRTVSPAAFRSPLEEHRTPAAPS
jgi:hypothetical protein